MDRDEVIETVNKINCEIMNIPNVHHCEFCDKPTEKGASHYVDMFYKRLIEEFSQPKELCNEILNQLALRLGTENDKNKK